MKVRLHIERVVVEGVALEASERELLATALQSRLSEFLLDAPQGQGLLAGGHIAHLATPPGQLSGHLEPRSLGGQIGDAVGATLCGVRARGRGGDVEAVGEPCSPFFDGCQ